MTIPNIIHFCFGLKEQKEPFLFVYYLAIYSAFIINKPDKIYFYYHYLPFGKYWDLINDILILEKVEIPNFIGSKPIKKIAHKADIIRMNKLYERGGVYFDIDTISVRPYKELLNYNCVLGYENIGSCICNAIMFTCKNGEFFKKWIDNYESYFNPDGWNESSIRLPFILSKTINDENILKILDVDFFFYPLYTDVDLIFEKDYDIPTNLITLHLWESGSMKYIQNINDLSWIYANKETLYSKIVVNLLNNYDCQKITTLSI